MNSYFLLNLCFVIYILVLLFNIGYLLYKKDNINNIGKYLCYFAFFLHSIGIIIKTIEAQHAPFTNMYESTIFFTWSTALLYIIFESKYKIKVLGIFTIPLVILGLGYSNTLSPISEPLIPALQSIWLEIHVATSFIGYAAFAIAYCVGLMYLLRTPKELDKAPSKFAIFNIAFLFAIIITFCTGVLLNFIEKIYGLLIFPVYNYRSERISEVIFGFALSNFILFLTFFISFILAYFICYLLREKFAEKYIALFSELNLSIVVTILIYYTIYGAVYTNNIIANRSNADLFKILSSIQILTVNTITCSIVFIFALIMLIYKRRTIEIYLPDLNILDSIIFIAISIGFPFLTLGIVTGAVWANSAWGTYWGWDPKETWSLITWFIYAAYLHSRYAKGWRDTKASYLAVFGFIAVIFTYFGVNLFFAGLHSYA